MAEHGDAKLTDLLATLADWPQGALGQRPRPVQGRVRGAGGAMPHVLSLRGRPDRDVPEAAVYIGDRVKRDATRDEIDFLLSDENGGRGERMKRVELNALDARSFIAFIEDKLVAHGVGKVTPDDGPLGEAYAAFVRAQRIRERLGAEIDAINAEPVEIPADLAERVQEKLAADPGASWDAVIEELASGGDNEEAEG
jgi:hypothetical protein